MEQLESSLLSAKTDTAINKILLRAKEKGVIKEYKTSYAGMGVTTVEVMISNEETEGVFHFDIDKRRKSVAPEVTVYQQETLI